MEILARVTTHLETHFCLLYATRSLAPDTNGVSTWSVVVCTHSRVHIKFTDSDYSSSTNFHRHDVSFHGEKLVTNQIELCSQHHVSSMSAGLIGYIHFHWLRKTLNSANIQRTVVCFVCELCVSTSKVLFLRRVINK